MSHADGPISQGRQLPLILKTQSSVVQPQPLETPKNSEPEIMESVVEVYLISTYVYLV